VRFTTGLLTRCSGGNHTTLPVTVGGVTADLVLSKDDLDIDFANRNEAGAAMIARLRSAVKEWAVANGTTPAAMTLAQYRSALNSKDFSL
jgi:hypothetical protein